MTRARVRAAVAAEPVRLTILAYDGVDDLDLFGAYAVLAKAAEISQALVVRIAAPAEVLTAGGVRIGGHSDLTALADADAVVVPGGRGAERAAADPALTAAISAAGRRGARIYGICSGAFVIVGAGLAADATVAVHQDKRERLRRAGAARVEAGLVRSGPLCTVGGDRRPSVKSVDLAFAVLRDFAPDLVEPVSARMEVLPGRTAVGERAAGRGWVLVTGATRGIGRATAEALAARGFDLVLWARSGDELTAVAESVAKAGVAVRVDRVDVADAARVEAAAAAALAPIDRLAGVVLNAGHGIWRPLSELDEAEWQDTLRTNLDGGFHVLRAALPALIRDRGVIVGVSSDAALYPFAHRAAYAAAKSGFHALLEVTRREVRAQGVRVSLVVPSRVDTHFAGAHAAAAPGSRPGALHARDVANVVANLFDQPAAVEVRETHLAAMTSTFGPYAERIPV